LLWVSPSPSNEKQRVRLVQVALSTIAHLRVFMIYRSMEKRIDGLVHLTFFPEPFGQTASMRFCPTYLTALFHFTFCLRKEAVAESSRPRQTGR
jgi:hypothetical protein